MKTITSIYLFIFTQHGSCYDSFYPDITYSAQTQYYQDVQYQTYSPSYVEQYVSDLQNNMLPQIVMPQNIFYFQTEDYQQSPIVFSQKYEQNTKHESLYKFHDQKQLFDNEMCELSTIKKPGHFKRELKVKDNNYKYLNNKNDNSADIMSAQPDLVSNNNFVYLKSENSSSVNYEEYLSSEHTQNENKTSIVVSNNNDSLAVNLINSSASQVEIIIVTGKNNDSNNFITFGNNQSSFNVTTQFLISDNSSLGNYKDNFEYNFNLNKNDSLGVHLNNGSTTQMKIIKVTEKSKVLKNIINLGNNQNSFNITTELPETDSSSSYKTRPSIIKSYKSDAPIELTALPQTIEKQSKTSFGHNFFLRKNIYEIIQKIVKNVMKSIKNKHSYKNKIQERTIHSNTAHPIKNNNHTKQLDSTTYLLYKHATSETKRTERAASNNHSERNKSTVLSSLFSNSKISPKINNKPFKNHNKPWFLNNIDVRYSKISKFNTSVIKPNLEKNNETKPIFRTAENLVNVKNGILRKSFMFPENTDLLHVPKINLNLLYHQINQTNPMVIVKTTFKDEQSFQYFKKTTDEINDTLISQQLSRNRQTKSSQEINLFLNSKSFTKEYSRQEYLEHTNPYFNIDSKSNNSNASYFTNAIKLPLTSIIVPQKGDKLLNRTFGKYKKADITTSLPRLHSSQTMNRIAFNNKSLRDIFYLQQSTAPVLFNSPLSTNIIKTIPNIVQKVTISMPLKESNNNRLDDIYWTTDSLLFKKIEKLFNPAASSRNVSVLDEKRDIKFKRLPITFKINNIFKQNKKIPVRIIPDVTITLLNSKVNNYDNKNQSYKIARSLPLNQSNISLISNKNSSWIKNFIDFIGQHLVTKTFRNKKLALVPTQHNNDINSKQSNVSLSPNQSYKKNIIRFNNHKATTQIINKKNISKPSVKTKLKSKINSQGEKFQKNAFMLLNISNIFSENKIFSMFPSLKDDIFRNYFSSYSNKVRKIAQNDHAIQFKSNTTSKRNNTKFIKFVHEILDDKSILHFKNVIQLLNRKSPTVKGTTINHEDISVNDRKQNEQNFRKTRKNACFTYTETDNAKVSLPFRYIKEKKNVSMISSINKFGYDLNTLVNSIHDSTSLNMSSTTATYFYNVVEVHKNNTALVTNHENKSFIKNILSEEGSKLRHEMSNNTLLYMNALQFKNSSQSNNDPKPYNVTKSKNETIIIKNNILEEFLTQKNTTDSFRKRPFTLTNILTNTLRQIPTNTQSILKIREMKMNVSLLNSLYNQKLLNLVRTNKTLGVPTVFKKNEEYFTQNKSDFELLCTKNISNINDNNKRLYLNMHDRRRMDENTHIEGKLQNKKSDEYVEVKQRSLNYTNNFDANKEKALSAKYDTYYKKKEYDSLNEEEECDTYKPEINISEVNRTKSNMTLKQTTTSLESNVVQLDKWLTGHQSLQNNKEYSKSSKELSYHYDRLKSDNSTKQYKNVSQPYFNATTEATISINIFHNKNKTTLEDYYLNPTNDFMTNLPKDGSNYYELIENAIESSTGSTEINSKGHKIDNNFNNLNYTLRNYTVDKKILNAENASENKEIMNDTYYYDQQINNDVINHEKILNSYVKPFGKINQITKEKTGTSDSKEIFLYNLNPTFSEPPLSHFSKDLTKFPQQNVFYNDDLNHNSNGREYYIYSNDELQSVHLGQMSVPSTVDEFLNTRKSFPGPMINKTALYFTAEPKSVNNNNDNTTQNNETESNKDDGIDQTSRANSFPNLFDHYMDTIEEIVLVDSTEIIENPRLVPEPA